MHARKKKKSYKWGILVDGSIRGHLKIHVMTEKKQLCLG
jgi:hypothetical protein